MERERAEMGAVMAWVVRAVLVLAVVVLPGGSLLLLAALAWRSRKVPGGDPSPLRLPAWFLPSRLLPAAVRRQGA